MDKTDILIVEDEEVVCAAARKILRSESISVDVVGDVESAIPRLADGNYRGLLTDLMLPGASGFDLLEQLRVEQPQLPVVIMTGYATLEIAINSFRQGAFDIIPKPFDSVELAGIASRVLRYAARMEGIQDKESVAAATGVSPDEMPRYFLGQHSWTTMDADGSFTIGVGETFPGLLDELEWIELPACGDELTQGDCLAKALSKSEKMYRIWSPLSGRVLSANADVEKDADLLCREPRGEGWLVRILPERLEQELELLSQRVWRPLSAGEGRPGASH